MKARLVSLIALMLIIFFASTVNCQWKRTGIQLLNNLYQGSGGVVTYKDGVVWACIDTLWISRDSGLTWQFSGHVAPKAINTQQEIVVSMVFNDSLNGLYSATLDKNVYHTTDGGKTWSILISARNPHNYLYDQVAAVTFDGTNDDILMSADGEIRSTRDGGKNWSSFSLPASANVQTFAFVRPGVVYCAAVDVNNGGIRAIYQTSDYGQTWVFKGQYFGIDNIAVDSCDENTLYAGVGESLAGKTGSGGSLIIISHDAGATWDTLLSMPDWDDLSGSIARGIRTIYAPSTARLTSGVYRSTDLGRSWNTVGGPSCPTDFEYITLINDSIVVAVDQNGDAWQTSNGGGYPVGPSLAQLVSIVPSVLFEFDTTECDSVTRVISLQNACKVTTAPIVSVLGVDSGSYRLGTLQNDSLPITFVPQVSGKHQALLTFTFDDGSADTVSLAGFATMGQIRIVTSDITNDTIGSIARIPITVTGLSDTEDVHLILYYHGNAKYLGTFDCTHSADTISGEEWEGRSKIWLHHVEPGRVAAWTEFLILSDSSGITTLIFDSIQVQDVAVCGKPIASHATITGPSGCGLNWISTLIAGGELNFTVRPNPASDKLEIDVKGHSSGKLRVIDFLGRELRCIQYTEHTFSLDIRGLSRGIYYITDTNGYHARFVKN